MLFTRQSEKIINPPNPLPTFPKARTNGLVMQEVLNETLVYDLDVNKAHCLNAAAAKVWNACDGINTVDAIAKETGLPADQVRSALSQLRESNLLA